MRIETAIQVGGSRIQLIRDADDRLIASELAEQVWWVLDRLDLNQVEFVDRINQLEKELP